MIKSETEDNKSEQRLHYYVWWEPHDDWDDLGKERQQELEEVNKWVNSAREGGRPAGLAQGEDKCADVLTHSLLVWDGDPLLEYILDELAEE